MAETDSRQQNQAFLQQLERQRLQKPCLRIIDLRGKVAGECQAYQIGQHTHYLDDRSYLLLKTLLQRSDNQFTVGVYEAWQKALQLLIKQDRQPTETTQKPILYRDSQQYQLLDFDSRIERRETRLNITTTALIDAGELRYHASTLNISASAMRLSMRRVQHLSEGQQVLISLPLMQQEAPDELLTEMTYQIKSLEHTAQQTTAIVQRPRDDDLALTNWLENWLAERQQLSVVDLDSELFNLAQEYYLRLFCQYFSTPLFWCDTALDTVLFINSSETADKALLPLTQQQLLQQLPIAVLSASPALLIRLTADGGLRWAATDNPAELKKLLSHSDHWYLLRCQPVAFAAESIQAQLGPLAERQADLATRLATQIQASQQLITLTNISAAITSLTPSDDIAESAASSAALPPLDLPEAQRLSLYIDRRAERFEIHTPIVLHINQQALTVTTNELSAGGLSVKVPAEVTISSGSRLTVDFVRWQQQSKLKLTGIPYEVRSQQSWQATNLLGLCRQTDSCSTAVNLFFEQVLAENKPKLGVRNDDLQLSLSSRLFADKLSGQLTDSLLFFGLDNDNNRILQAVAATHQNAAREKAAFWQALGAQAGRLTQPLKLPISDLQTPVSFGIYGFRRTPHGEWQINSDLAFTDAASKQLFIRRALAAGEYCFFHCHLQPIKTGAWNAAADLQQQLNHLRRHNSHKVKQIRETLHCLFAIAQLTDITDLIASQMI